MSLEKLKKVLSCGSSHYVQEIEPVEYIAANGLNFFEGNVVKYVSRAKKRDGARDIIKAIHYLLMILAEEYDIADNAIVSELYGLKLVCDELPPKGQD